MDWEHASAMSGSPNDHCITQKLWVFLFESFGCINMLCRSDFAWISGLSELNLSSMGDATVQYLSDLHVTSPSPPFFFMLPWTHRGLKRIIAYTTVTHCSLWLHDWNRVQDKMMLMSSKCLGNWWKEWWQTPQMNKKCPWYVPGFTEKNIIVIPIQAFLTFPD